MVRYIKNVRLHGVLTDIGAEDGKIASIGKTAAAGFDGKGAKIYPGLIDVHTHGCVGFDAMEGHLAEMADFQLSRGTTTFYPTTMSMPLDDLVRATAESLTPGHGANMPGFHAEGPFLNKKFKGAMNEDYIVPPTKEFFDAMKNVAIITLAPEIPGAIEFIKSCPAVVSVGHTDADYDTVRAAFSAGAKCLTHTYNAMNGIHHRAPGPIGAGFDTPGVYAQLISDGKHVHPSAVRMLVNLFGTDRVILISDSMRACGLGDGVYSFGGQTTIVKDATALTETGHLAGSTATLFDCVSSAISFGIPEEDAVKMATENPAKMMGLKKGKIEVGLDADFILVDDDFRLQKAIVRGEF